MNLISMLPLLSWTICLVVFALGGIDARTIDTHITSFPTSDISSSTLAESTVTTASSQSCIYIKTCRTLDQIVVSCLATVLACVWFAVHRNIPAPKPEPSYHSNFFFKCAQRVWAAALGQSEAAVVGAVALIAPEWILAWAVRQAIVAWRLARRLEKARLILTAGEFATSTDGHSSIKGSSTHTDRDSEASELIQRPHNLFTSCSTCAKYEGRGHACDRIAFQKRVAKGNERWTWSHGFLASMGGFHFYNAHGPMHPLSPADVIELVQRGHLVPPTAGEISDRSKGNALSKCVAIAQTLWFVAQCVTRHAEHLPVTSLEVMTLAYTVMTVAMYITWWAKPLNVSCAVRVPQEDVGGREAEEYGSIGEMIMAYTVGSQDGYVDLRKCTRVPTFWSGDVDGEEVGPADVIAFFVTMMFGAVHCIAWYSKFGSPLEQQLWRSSAIVITAFPVALIVAIILVVLINKAFDSKAVGMFLAYVLYTLVAIVYIAARIILIFLSFSSLKALPFGAYQTVQWTTFIPHI